MLVKEAVAAESPFYEELELPVETLSEITRHHPKIQKSETVHEQVYCNCRFGVV